jgi:dipeptidyl aminopeptidase/acylaminoacyl peptidase
MTPRTLRTAAAFAALLFVSLPADAQQPAAQPISFNDIMALRHVGSPALSPDGRLVAYTVSGWEHPDAKSDSVLGDRHEMRSRIWLVSASGGDARQLTFGERGERAPQWAPDGRHLAFIAARGTGADVRPQVWLLPLAGGEARQLTSADGGVESFAWSPDGGRIAYVTPDSLDSAERARQRRRDDARVYEEGFRLSHVWVFDLATEKAIEVGHGEFTVRGAPEWSPDGALLAFTVHATPMIRDLRGGIWIAAADGSDLRRAAPAVRPYHALLTQPAWSPDGRTLAFSTMRMGDDAAPDGMVETELDQRHLVLLDVATGAVREIRDPSFDLDITAVRWSPDGRRLVFVTGDRAFHAVAQYDTRNGSFSRIATGIVLGGMSWSSDMARVAFVMESADAPAEVFIGDGRFAAPRRLTDTNPWVRDRAIGTTEVITWLSPDGTEVEGILLKPAGYQPGSRVPLLVEVHGGPTAATTSGFMASASSPGQFWAGEGWAVLYPNPRGSTSYGRDFMRANLLDWGGGDFQDVMSGVDAVIARGVADSTRMAIVGWSYGGFMTAWTVTQTSRFRAARMGAGMSEIQGMYLTTDIPGYIGTFFGGAVSDDTRELYVARSPVTHAHRVTTPLLILHGAEDTRVPTGQALAFYRALRNAGATVQLVFYPRAGHGLGEYYHQLDRMRRDHDWITRHAGMTDSTSSPD